MIGERDRIAEALPGYEIEGELGRGGWGVVLGGRHRQLGREVAIKQLPPAFAGNPEVRERFTAEARVLAALDHPHVVPVYDYVENDQVCLLVMEKLPGGTVWTRFTTAGLAMPAACAVVMAACAGLQCAHKRGIFHRDVKPENMMFSSEGTLKVTDFGIAKVINGTTTKATRVGEVLGTPAYMAPEQVKGEEITSATDVYATGVMLYELLSGRLPFPEDDEPQLMLYRHGYEAPQHISAVAPQVPAPLADVTMWALETSPSNRCPTADDLSAAVSDAAVEAWGADWLSKSDVPVLATSANSAATTKGRTYPPRARDTARRRAPAASTRRPSSAPPQAGAGPPPAAPPPVAPPPSAPVRPEVSSHVQGAKANDVAVADLVPVHEVVPRPPSPALPWLAALALLLVAVAVALAGVGSPPRVGGDARPRIIVGTPDDKGDAVVDLSKPVPVVGSVVPEAAGADSVQVALGVDKLDLAEATVPLPSGPDGRFATEVDLTGRRFLVTGTVEARVRFLSGGRVVAQRALPVKTSPRSLLTVPGGLALALVLLVFAYAESILRSMRRGRKAVTGPPGLAVVGALAGALAVVGAWVAADVEVTRGSLVACAVLGAASGLAAAWGARRLSRRVPARRR